ncbi:MAG: YybH family protein [Caulobacteraceae bacterium]
MVAVLLLAGPSLARPVAPPSPIQNPPAAAPAAQQIEDTERAFAQVVAQGGIVPGFRQFAAPDAVMFLPDPTPAQAALAGARWTGELVWRAQYVAVAASGDLAFSAGPSLLRGGGRPSGGFYLTVWRRQPDGGWKFVLDQGADMPPGIWGGPPRPLITLNADPPSAPPSNEGMREADGSLNVALPKGAAEAFAQRLDDQAILVRTMRPPAQGRRRALALVADTSPILEAFTIGGSRSMDGSFGYTYGRARWAGPAGPQTGYYVRVWRATPQGWRLLADQLTER